MTPPLPPPPPNLLISKKSSSCRVKLRMSIKTIQLICNALQMISFYMIQIFVYCKVKMFSVSHTTHTKLAITCSKSIVKTLA